MKERPVNIFQEQAALNTTVKRDCVKKSLAANC
jgi:hypothetical protein